MSSLPKPVLRGHIKRGGLKVILGSLCFAAVNATLFHFFVVVPRREAYVKFVETYDADAHYEDLLKWGYYSFPRVLEELKGGS